MTPEALEKRYGALVRHYTLNENTRNKDGLLSAINKAIETIVEQAAEPKPRKPSGASGTVVLEFSKSLCYLLKTVIQQTFHPAVDGRNAWTQYTPLTTQSIAARRPDLMNGKLGTLLEHRKSVAGTVGTPRKRKAPETSTTPETPTPASKKRRVRNTPMVESTATDMRAQISARPLDTAVTIKIWWKDGEHRTLLAHPTAHRVTLAHYKIELGQRGLEQGESLEMIQKKRKQWNPVRWDTPIPAASGDLILLRAAGITDTPGWEIDVANM